MMMRCPFQECRMATTVPMTSQVHLIVAIGDDNRTYIHGPYDTQEGRAWIMRMLVEVARLAKVDLQELVDKEREVYGNNKGIPLELMQ